MQRFAELFERLDRTTKTNEKITAIADYLQETLRSAPDDAAWAIHYLSGRRVKRLIQTGLLRRWAAEEAAIPDWLFEESYQSVGDLAETISLVVPPGNKTTDRSLRHWVEEEILPLAADQEPIQRQRVVSMWRESRGTSRLVLMKLITGAFRLGVSTRLVAKGVAQASGIPADVIAHRLMGNWQPDATFIAQLTSPDTGDAQRSRPYPFCLAHPVPSTPSDPLAPSDPPPPSDASPKTNLPEDPRRSADTADQLEAVLGEVSQWTAEWKWDGIRGQIIRRDGQTFIWSRGQELMMGRWPELESGAEFLPDGTVIDGEILASRWSGGRVEVLPFAALQRRIGRTRIGKTLLQQVPVLFHAFDCLEYGGNDLRERPWTNRWEQLVTLFEIHQPANMVINQPLSFERWKDLADLRLQSREHHAEGLMLKRRDSPYSVGRVRGNWWKWKLDPMTVDAVLIYAQRGHGKRAGLYTDYTFAVWNQDELVPFAKAYSGLTDAEIREVDRYVRDHTTERFGPVRRVQPQLVMELAFEGLQRSRRHKSGIATRFPRIARWRRDKAIEDADRLGDLLSMLPEEADRVSEPA